MSQVFTALMGSSGKLVLLLIAAIHYSQCQSAERDFLKKLPTDICGTTPSSIDSAIVGGKPAKLGEFPWMALIGYDREETGKFAGWACGGSLITTSHVITAAHCLHPDDITIKQGTKVFQTYKPVSVRLGELDYSTDDDKDQHKDYDIETFTIHKGYNSFHEINDLGIIKLKRSVDFTDTVRPICLPPVELRSMTFEGDWPTIAGWGKISFGAPTTSTKLLKAKVKVTNLDECRANLTKLKVWEAKKELTIDGSVMCAAAEGTDACQGDSGGPLMFLHQPEDEEDTRYYMIGVVSYGYGCAEEGFPGVFSRVSYHLSWILDNLN